MDYVGIYSTSKFEQQVAKEAEDYWKEYKKKKGAEGPMRWSDELPYPPKHQQKRAPLWIETARGPLSICRLCAERIKKGTMRFGTHSPNPYGWQSYYWHPYCYTAQVMKELAYAEEMEAKL